MRRIGLVKRRIGLMMRRFGDEEDWVVMYRFIIDLEV